MDNTLDFTKTTHKNIVSDKEEIKRVFLLAYNDNTNHTNQNNYSNIDKRLKGYVRFDVLYLGNEVVSFSGLWSHDKWGKIARAADRYYIFKKYRSKSLMPNYEVSAASKIFIPKQFKTALELNLNPFVSIQNIKRNRDIEILKRRLKQMHNLNCVILEKLRYTCVTGSSSINCWQNILTLKSCKDAVDAVLPYKLHHN
tara:strand:- start:2562 stop:3155 length:594 start_codon:yes stop_codon:yes gene_type:complete